MKRTGRQAEAIKKFNAVIQNHPHSKYAFYAKLQLKKMESYQNTVNPENEFCLQTSPV
jgi:outer membrane protein assembly factor BamD (BamD/ComL family)